MAAKLEWRAHRLMLGAFPVGQVLDVVNMTPRAWRFAVAGRERVDELSDPYEPLTDCMQDLESEVRRLLKEAGVVVE